MRYWQASTGTTKELEVGDRPFFALDSMNRNLHPGEYWTFKDWGFHELSPYVSIQGPSDGDYVWTNDHVKYERTKL